MSELANKTPQKNWEVNPYSSEIVEFYVNQNHLRRRVKCRLHCDRSCGALEGRRPLDHVTDSFWPFNCYIRLVSSLEENWGNVFQNKFSPAAVISDDLFSLVFFQGQALVESTFAWIRELVMRGSWLWEEKTWYRFSVV